MAERLSASVAMATYNGERFLREQLQSLVEQRVHPDELVITDDGSSDGTEDIVLAFRATAPFPVRYERNTERLGYTRNFAKAAALCTSDIVFFCDQDDWWRSDKISTCLAYFADHPETIVLLNDAMIANSALRPIGKRQYDLLLRYGEKKWNYVTGCCSSHRRVWQSLVLPLPSDLNAFPVALQSHDVWINGLAHHCGVSAVINDDLQLYRRHDSNVSESSLSDPKSSALKDTLNGGFAPGGKAWLAQAAFFQLMIDRLRDYKADDHRSIAAETIDRGIARMERLRDALIARSELSRLNRTRRLPRIAKLLARGGYHRIARGYVSAAKDIVRP